MTMITHDRAASIRQRSQGFSLIEVLIALVVLAIGLLGLGLLQTMNLRYTQSANQRTVATTLAGELLDTIRTNRSLANAYAMTPSDFTVKPTRGTGCGSIANLNAAANATRWRCEVMEKLGDGASAEVITTGLPQISVSITWDDLPGETASVRLETTL
ncbi:type IV pilus modification protein PilV [Luteimonas sp. SMYT11W]|uniref:Type IV pilus modification protein PilV n=1 Tax=Luteimonas flava TaxID=3115822 RepID=A0ABU7W9V2_9GAMM